MWHLVVLVVIVLGDFVKLNQDADLSSFTTMDTNDDGKLSPTEIAKTVRPNTLAHQSTTTDQMPFPLNPTLHPPVSKILISNRTFIH